MSNQNHKGWRVREVDEKFPIGQLIVPEHVTVAHVEAWMNEIKTYIVRLAFEVEGLSEGELQKTYREGSWTVRELVHHIADSQLVMYQRLKLALTDDQPNVPPFDQDAWAKLADMKMPIETSMSMLKGINERVVQLGLSLTEIELARTFTLQPDTVITVATKLAKLAWHEEHHLAHIKLALRK